MSDFLYMCHIIAIYIFFLYNNYNGNNSNSWTTRP